MATSNSTTTSQISGSLPASQNTTSSTVFNTSTTISPTTKATIDVGRASDIWTTSTITFVTVSLSAPMTSTLTTVVRISGASLSGSPSFRRPLSTVNPLTQTTKTFTEALPKSESSSSGISDASNTQRRPFVPVLVIVGLVVASCIAGILFLLFFCRHRRRCRQKEAERLSQLPESCSSFLDTDPFVCMAQNLAPSMRSAEDEERGITQPGLDATMSNWWDSGNGAFVFRKPISLENDNGATTLSSQHGTQRSSPCLPTTYPSILFEQDEMVGEGQPLERYAAQRNLDGPLMHIPISRHLPPPRPPRSPRLTSKTSAHHSFDSVSTAHSSFCADPREQLRTRPTMEPRH